jgi:transposase-like protein
MQTTQQQYAAAKGRRVIARNRLARRRAIHRRYVPPLNEPFFMLGLGLYCGEGTKDDRVAFSSASPKLIRQMLRWFRRYFGVKDADFCLCVRHYGCRTEATVKRHWKQHTGIAKNKMQVAITPASRWSRHQKGQTLLYGTAYLRLYKSARIRIQITKAQALADVMPKP